MNKRMLRSCGAVLLSLGVVLGAGSARADEPVIRVLALFPGKAMLSIDGQRRLLSQGQTSPEGVELVSADTDRALVRVGGEQLSLEPGGVVSAAYAKPAHRETRVTRDASGAYLVGGMVNGRAVNFLVDTGASSVVLGEAEARRLGIPFERDGTPIRVLTASGLAEGFRIRFDRVRVGEIELRGVEGSVVLGDGPSRALLGMSFLNRLQLENRGNVLVMRYKF